MQTYLVAHLHFSNAISQPQKCKRATKPTHQDTAEYADRPRQKKKQRTPNIT